MKRILLPTDFSDNSWNAIDYATELFKDENCTFFLLNAYTKIIYELVHISDVPYKRNVENTIKTNAVTNLEHLKKTIEHTTINEKHQFKTIAAFGTLVEVMEEFVKSKKIDLIVMGTKGASGAKGVFMGSNTVRVINTIKKCPVIAVPENFTFISKPSEITFATDFTHFYSKEELQPIVELAKSFRATIRIIYIQKQKGVLTEEQKFNLGMLQKYFKDITYFQHTLTQSESISKSIKVFAEELDIYLLAMLNYPHSFIDKLTREPVIKNMAFHTQIPLLVIPELGMSSALSKTIKSHSKLEGI
ncbi:Nucleotide-binding universal stress protein, UspA family [Aquimarina amphilecti]|uniref:Nucleotide-binding universal stress protein, UspA family n=1 Tax=Aquimarina amphilecti TaxID=1038014 RepID=A0A1H7MG64_AQUAM|nr:universal stress protein [Aquimarina amphilecti]SEL09617.1 Nucleotide-binding universal stress protein, UspA family [Aquimarina amphilecti]